MGLRRRGLRCSAMKAPSRAVAFPSKSLLKQVGVVVDPRGGIWCAFGAAPPPVCRRLRRGDGSRIRRSHYVLRRVCVGVCVGAVVAVGAGDADVVVIAATADAVAVVGVAAGVVVVAVVSVGVAVGVAAPVGVGVASPAAVNN